MKEILVEENAFLYEYLRSKLVDLSKNNIKKLLHDNYIYVNNKCITKYNYKINKGDIIKIKSTNKLDIIYEDKYIIVVNKPYNLLTVSTDGEKNNTLYNMVSSYVKKTNKNNKIFVIHRLDKDTSGIVMFAKTQTIKNMYQNNWNDIVKKRCYYAIVDGILTKNEGTIKSYLTEKNMIVYSTKDKKIGKLAITDYNVIKSNNNFSLLNINIKTGRKNQIRVHMKENNTPILGDRKYGKKDKSKRMFLHAYKLELLNPITKKNMAFETNMPEEFNKIIK